MVEYQKLNESSPIHYLWYTVAENENENEFVRTKRLVLMQSFTLKCSLDLPRCPTLRDKVINHTVQGQTLLEVEMICMIFDNGTGTLLR